MHMGTNGNSTLLQRIGRLLRAKQFLVFYAIGLFALSYAAPLATGWLREQRPLGGLASDDGDVFSDLAATRSLAVATVALVSLALGAWFRAGYLRSLLGRLSWRPATGRQFRRLFGLSVIYQLAIWGFSYTITALGAEDAEVDPGGTAALVAQLVIVASLVVWLLLLYVDYAIVASDTSLWRSFRRSLATVRRNVLISVLVALVPVVVTTMVSSLATGPDDGAARALPTIVILVFLWGAVSFVTDVVLLSVYLDTLERDRGRSRQAVGDGR